MRIKTKFVKSCFGKGEKKKDEKWEKTSVLQKIWSFAKLKKQSKSESESERATVAGVGHHIPESDISAIARATVAGVGHHIPAESDISAIARATVAGVGRYIPAESDISAIVRATVAAAEAAVAAVAAANALVTITTRARESSAATKIQSAYRAHLARRALKALKGLVKFQAHVRGFLVRKRTTAEFVRAVEAVISAQGSARFQRARLSLPPSYLENASSFPAQSTTQAQSIGPSTHNNSYRTDPSCMNQAQFIGAAQSIGPSTHIKNFPAQQHYWMSISAS